MGEKQNVLGKCNKLVKKTTKKVISWLLIMAMLVTLPQALPGMTTEVKADTAKMNVTLHFDNTVKNYTAPALHVWGGTSTSVTDGGEEEAISGWGEAKGRRMTRESETSSWKITIDGDLTGFQILDMDSPDGNNVVKSTDDIISALQQYAEVTATDIYVLNKGEGYKFYSDSLGETEIQPPASAIANTDLTVHFKNERSWEKAYVMLGEGSNWTPIEGIEFCKSGFGGVIQDDTNNAGWKSFKVTKTGSKDVNGNFNCGEWGDLKQTGNFNVKITAETMEVWITFTDVTQQTGDAAKEITVSEQKPEEWVDGGTIPAILDADGLAVNKTEDTKIKLYYYIPADAECSTYGLNLWGGAKVTEGGDKLTVTAWGDKPRCYTLLDAGSANTIEGLDGKWAYIALDGGNVEGLQFVTANGRAVGALPGDSDWYSTIKNLGLTAAYFVPGNGWYKDPQTDEEIAAPVLHDIMYIVGAADSIGAWNLANAALMTKNGDEYSVTVPMSAGTYEYTPVQDPAVFAWTHQYKDSANEYKNYSVTLEDDRNVTFIVRNVNPTDNTADVVALKNYTVTFKDGDKVLKTQNILEGDTATAPATPTKAGYVFKGWDKDYSAVSSDLTVSAKWEVNAPAKYTVTFKNGSKVVSTQSIESGKAAKAPKITKKGYTLKWNKSFSKVTANMTVSAVWTANKYKVNYNVNGGSKLKTTSKTVTYAKTYGTLAVPKRAGYDFAGWYTAKTKGNKITSKSKVTITKATTIYARWSKITKPSKVSKPTVKNSSSKAMKVSYKSVKGADGYEIRYSTKSNMKSAKVITTTAKAKTIKNLKKGKTYYVQVRAYKVDSASKKIYSSVYSSKVKVKISK